ncbi:uncharacterized protein LOC143285412 [Babylonia areolata]|uniref:uncharacterized protein LOC143285412 n=1 Tax=Babylonia areolata TaxID=304850 RepID=UPI003FD4211B
MMRFVSSNRIWMCILTVMLVLVGCLLSQDLGDRDRRSNSWRHRYMERHGSSVGDVSRDLDQKFDHLDQRLRNIERHLSGHSDEIPFAITRVEKSEFVSAYRVKVEFEGSPKPDYAIVSLNDISLQRFPQPSLGDNVVFDIPKPDDGDTVLISFYLPERLVTARLDLESKYSTMALSRLHVDVLQARPVVVPTGEDLLQLDYFFDVEAYNEDDFTEEAPRTQVLIPSETDENVFLRYKFSYDKFNYDLKSIYDISEVPVQLDLVASGRAQNHHYGRFVLNLTDVNNIERGLVKIDFGVSFNCKGNCLVLELRDAVSLQFFREGHGPLLPLYGISFIRNHFTPNRTLIFCEADSGPCELSCEALANGGLDKMMIGRNTSRGTIQPLPSVSFFVGDLGTAQLLLPNVSFGDGGEYWCVAFSTEYRRPAAEVLSLVVFRKAQIIAERSNVTRLENGTYQAVCVADGNPAPDITLRAYRAWLSDSRLPEPHVTHPSQWQTRVDLFFSEDDVYDGLMGFYCFASSVPMHLLESVEKVDYINLMIR